MNSATVLAGTDGWTTIIAGTAAIQTTGAHEFGHGLGLLHVNTEYNIMGNDFEHIHVNGSTATAYTGEDAADATVFLYGARSPAWCRRWRSPSGAGRSRSP